jgi:hypothetical protein
MYGILLPDIPELGIQHFNRSLASDIRLVEDCEVSQSWWEYAK